MQVTDGTPEKESLYQLAKDSDKKDTISSLQSCFLWPKHALNFCALLYSWFWKKCSLLILKGLEQKDNASNLVPCSALKFGTHQYRKHFITFECLLLFLCISCFLTLNAKFFLISFYNKSFETMLLQFCALDFLHNPAYPCSTLGHVNEENIAVLLLLGWENCNKVFWLLQEPSWW